MTQLLRALIALAEDPGSVLSTHMVSQSSLTPVPGDLFPLLTSAGTMHAHGAHAYTQTKHIK